MISEKAGKWLKFLCGLLGWFIVNTLLYAMLNKSYGSRFDLLSDFQGLFWILVLAGNLIALIVLAILKKTRWIALGIISAMAVNFAINMVLLQFKGAYCFVPFTYAPPAKNQFPIGSLNGNKGKVSQDNCVAYGWAVDPDNRNADVILEMTSDNRKIATTTANIYRPELKILGRCPDGTCGFEVDLWPLITHNVEHEIRILVQDAQTGIWTYLRDSPIKIDCQE